jgi:hypothetical protein
MGVRGKLFVRLASLETRATVEPAHKDVLLLQLIRAIEALLEIKVLTK